MIGSVKFGLWHVHVHWEKNIIFRISFVKKPVPSSVPVEISRFLAGISENFGDLISVGTTSDYPFSNIYQAVERIEYGTTTTYGEIASIAGTYPRVVGLALKRNPTPLIIPCHRVIGKKSIGGFTPDISIKEDLLSLEQTRRKKKGRNCEKSPS